MHGTFGSERVYLPQSGSYTLSDPRRIHGPLFDFITLILLN